MQGGGRGEGGREGRMEGGKEGGGENEKATNEHVVKKQKEKVVCGT